MCFEFLYIRGDIRIRFFDSLTLYSVFKVRLAVR